MCGVSGREQSQRTPWSKFIPISQDKLNVPNRFTWICTRFLPGTTSKWTQEGESRRPGRGIASITNNYLLSILNIAPAIMFFTFPAPFDIFICLFLAVWSPPPIITYSMCSINSAAWQAMVDSVCMPSSPWQRKKNFLQETICKTI